ncbi:MFS general substrate transporter [Rhizoctonia solani]|uniref:MFS general substrate transporter n=1 Tax=Rhizoctonia solani TaxID=456999 RepID=A0A8H7IDP2_9AGAM|nr:MFS general substrate transporter [Rhizoctonia solani]
MSASDADSYKQGQSSVGQGLGESENSGDPFNESHVVEYRLYKRRWTGLLGVCLLNFVAGAAWCWFASIAIPVSEDFGISLGQVNWLANCVNVAFLPVSLVIPSRHISYVLRWGQKVLYRNDCDFGWSMGPLRRNRAVPFPNGKFGLLLFGQILLGIGQPWFLIIGPKYSEVWFDLKGRTTATMLVSISNPIGTSFGQIVAPYCPSVRVSKKDTYIGNNDHRPGSVRAAHIFGSPTPPTFSGSHPSPPPIQTLRAFLGRSRSGEITMTPRERLDSVILLLTFGLMVAALNTLGIILAQAIAPYGYTPEDAGIIGGVYVLAGIVGAVVIMPIFDRYLTHHLALASKVITTMLAACFISLIWAVREDNAPAIYVIVVVLGISCFTLLPITLEIACEITRSPEASSAILWLLAYLLTTIFIPSKLARVLEAPTVPTLALLVVDHMRDDSPTANPPSNMRRGLIFEAGIAASCVVIILGLRGKQSRRELDVQKQQEAARRGVII